MRRSVATATRPGIRFSSTEIKRNMEITGNLVVGNEVFFGALHTRGKIIETIRRQDAPQSGAPWVVPGFIDLHLHGLGPWGSLHPQDVRGMAEFAPATGVTTLCPTLDSEPTEVMIEFLRAVRRLAEHPIAGAARIAGTHLEGPYLNAEHGGGMNPAFLRLPDLAEVELLWETAGETLRIMTIAPELPGAGEVIRRLAGRGVVMSMGHCGLSCGELSAAVAAGIAQVCHLYDTYDGRTVKDGVVQPSLADAVLLDDRLMIELIGDGFHVPEELIALTRRAAGARRIIAITDAMQGAGLPDGVYAMTDGRKYTLCNRGVCRLQDHPETIVGSCLTMNRVFRNLIERFGFSPSEAVAATSGNAARQLRLNDRLGALREGLQADIAVLSAEDGAVMQCVRDGADLYRMA